MNKSIILSLALIAFCSIPILAAAPEQENAPIMEEGQEFSDLIVLNDGEMILILRKFISVSNELFGN